MVSAEGIEPTTYSVRVSSRQELAVLWNERIAGIPLVSCGLSLQSREHWSTLATAELHQRADVEQTWQRRLMGKSGRVDAKSEAKSEAKRGAESAQLSVRS